MTPLIDEIKRAAAGRWRELLSELGPVDSSILDGNHHSCPRCGGTDRFRMIDREVGALFCNQCFSKENGDGISALRWLRGGIPFPETLELLAGRLGISNGNGGQAKRERVAEWTYRDEAGRPLYTTVRFRDEHGKKSYAYRAANGTWSLKGVRIVPYCLPELLELPDDARIFVAEGEKCVEAVRRLGLAATTSPMGAGKWKQVEEGIRHTAFERFNVVVLPDNDDPGRAHAEDVAEDLLGHTRSVRILTLPGLSEKEDVADWIPREVEEHDGAEDPVAAVRAKLEGLADAAPPWQPGEKKPRPSIWDIHYVCPSIPVVKKPASFVEDLAIQGYVAASGPPKVSKKSWFFIALTLHIHTGMPFLGRPVVQAPCAWIQLDMAEWDFQDYCDRIARGMGLPEARMPYFFANTIDLANREHWEPLAKTLGSLGTKLLVIDSSRAASSADENKSVEVKPIVRDLFCGRLRSVSGIAPYMIAHTPKGASGIRGSGEWVSAADSVLEFHPSENQDGLIEIMGLGRHKDFKLTFEFQDLGQEGSRIVEVGQEEVFKRKTDVKPIQIETAYRYVAEHPQGATQNAILGDLAEKGYRVQRSQGHRLVDAILREHPDVAFRQVKKGQYPTRELFISGGINEKNTTEGLKVDEIY